jgi:hypothetical protein
MKYGTVLCFVFPCCLMKTDHRNSAFFTITNQFDMNMTQDSIYWQ